jgi:hypothetical protein
MSQTDDELGDHFPEAVEVSVRKGEKVAVEPLRLEQFSPVRKAMKPLMDLFTVPVEKLPAGATVEHTVDFLLDQVMASAEDEARLLQVVTFLEKATDISAGEIRTFNLAVITKLLRVVLEVNFDFFTRAVAPEISRALHTLSQVLVAARGHGPTASSG